LFERLHINIKIRRAATILARDQTIFGHFFDFSSHYRTSASSFESLTEAFLSYFCPPVKQSIGEPLIQKGRIEPGRSVSRIIFGERRYFFWLFQNRVPRLIGAAPAAFAENSPRADVYLLKSMVTNSIFRKLFQNFFSVPKSDDFPGGPTRGF
jgi:hypothetical protein